MTLTPPEITATFSPVGVVSDSTDGPIPSARGKIFTLRKVVRGAGSGSGAGTVCGIVGRSWAVWSGASVGGRRVGDVAAGGAVRGWAKTRLQIENCKLKIANCRTRRAARAQRLSSGARRRLSFEVFFDDEISSASLP